MPGQLAPPTLSKIQTLPTSGRSLKANEHTRSRFSTAKMGRVRTKTVKKSAKVIIERYYPRLSLDFETNKRIVCDGSQSNPRRMLTSALSAMRLQSLLQSAYATRFVIFVRLTLGGTSSANGFVDCRLCMLPQIILLEPCQLTL